MQAILIVKTSAIGDVIQTLDVLSYLRARFPHAQIDWVVESGIAPLLNAHPLISRVLTTHFKAWRKAPFSKRTRAEFEAFCHELRRTRYDVLFDLQANSKSALITLLANAEVKVGYDWKGVKEKTNLLVTHVKYPADLSGGVRQKYIQLVKDHFKDGAETKAQGTSLKLLDAERQRLEALCGEAVLQKRPRLMVAMGSKWENKRLSHATLLSFLRLIDQHYSPAFVFIYADAEEQKLAQGCLSVFPSQSIAVGELSLPLWQGLMAQMDGVITVDSAALHLCGTTATPSFSVFGPSLASIYKPLGSQHATFQGECPYDERFAIRCPKLRTCSTGACMKEISSQKLFEAFQAWANSNFLSVTTSM